MTLLSLVILVQVTWVGCCGILTAVKLPPKQSFAAPGQMVLNPSHSPLTPGWGAGFINSVFSKLFPPAQGSRMAKRDGGKCESRKAVATLVSVMLDVTISMWHYLSVTLQSHSPWKDCRFWSCGHSGGLLPRELRAQLQPRVAPWTWLDGSFQHNQHKVLLTQICLLWVFVEASNFTLQIIILSCFAWILAKNTRLAQPATAGSFWKENLAEALKTGRRSWPHWAPPPLLWPWWSLGWWDTALF